MRVCDQARLREGPSQDTEVHRGSGLRRRAALRVQAGRQTGASHF